MSDGTVLPITISMRVERRDQKLLERAELAFAGHGERGHDQAHQGRQNRHQGGHRVPGGFQVGVEPDPRGHDARRRRCACAAASSRSKPSMIALRIAGDDLGRVRAPAVQDELDLGRHSPFQPPREVRADMHDHEHAPRVDGRGNVGLAAQVANLGEVGRALEPCDQVAPGGAVVFVENGHPHVLHLLRGREGEDEHLDDRRHDEDVAALRVAQNGEQLFDDQ